MLLISLLSPSLLALPFVSASSSYIRPLSLLQLSPLGCLLSPFFVSLVSFFVSLVSFHASLVSFHASLVSFYVSLLSFCVSPRLLSGVSSGLRSTP